MTGACARPTELYALVRAAIAARLPVLVTGAPGLGKSQIVEAAAAAEGADMILSHPAVADPTDAKGLPWPSPEGDCATFLPFGELARALKATKPTVWFLDDLGQAPPSVQASFMQLLLARRVNGHALPDCVTFVAATNRRTDRAGVSGILEPVKSRFAFIVELTAHIDDWCAWAFGHGIPPELIAFLRFRTELLCDFKASADLTNSPLPRTWAHAARILALGLPRGIEQAALCGAVGEGAAVEFSAFRRFFAEMPNIDEILRDPDRVAVPDRPETLYAIVTALGMRATTANFPKVGRYAERLVAAKHGEFAALLLRDIVARDAGVMQSPTFVKLAAGPLGELIDGSKA